MTKYLDWILVIILAVCLAFVLAVPGSIFYELHTARGENLYLYVSFTMWFLAGAGFALVVAEAVSQMIKERRAARRQRFVVTHLQADFGATKDDSIGLAQLGEEFDEISRKRWERRL